MKSYEEALKVAVEHQNRWHKMGRRCSIHIVKKGDYYTTAYSAEELAYAIENGFEEVTK